MANPSNLWHIRRAVPRGFPIVCIFGASVKQTYAACCAPVEPRRAAQLAIECICRASAWKTCVNAARQLRHPRSRIASALETCATCGTFAILPRAACLIVRIFGASVSQTLVTVAHQSSLPARLACRAHPWRIRMKNPSNLWHIRRAVPRSSPIVCIYGASTWQTHAAMAHQLDRRAVAARPLGKPVRLRLISLAVRAVAHPPDWNR